MFLVVDAVKNGIVESGFKNAFRAVGPFDPKGVAGESNLPVEAFSGERVADVVFDGAAFAKLPPTTFDVVKAEGGGGG